MKPVPGGWQVQCGDKHVARGETAFLGPPDSAFPYSNAATWHLVQRLRRDLDGGVPLIVLVGPRGIGKSVLLRYLERSLGQSRETLLVNQFDACSAAVERRARGSRLCLVDDADALGPETLGALRAQLDNQQGRVQVILAGTEALRSTWIVDSGPAGTVPPTYELEPFSREDTFAYIDHRCRAAGLPCAPFTTQAADAIHDLADGVPARIDRLCLAALRSAAERGTWLIRDGLVTALSAEQPAPAATLAAQPAQGQSSAPTAPLEMPSAVEVAGGDVAAAPAAPADAELVQRQSAAGAGQDRMAKRETAGAARPAATAAVEAVPAMAVTPTPERSPASGPRAGGRMLYWVRNLVVAGVLIELVWLALPRHRAPTQAAQPASTAHTGVRAGGALAVPDVGTVESVHVAPIPGVAGGKATVGHEGLPVANGAPTGTPSSATRAAPDAGGRGESSSESGASSAAAVAGAAHAQARRGGPAVPAVAARPGRQPRARRQNKASMGAVAAVDAPARAHGSRHTAAKADPSVALLRRAEAFMTAGQFTQPPGANAWDVYKRILARDPGDRRARQDMASIARRCDARSRALLSHGDLRGALRMVKQGLRISPSDQALLNLQIEIWQRHRDR